MQDIAEAKLPPGHFDAACLDLLDPWNGPLRNVGKSSNIAFG